MPVCRKCGSRISKFDKDFCPICGEKNPLDGVSSETIEITSDLTANKDELGIATPRSKKKTFLYFSLFGWTGLAFVYLRSKKLALIWGLINIILIIVGLGSIFCFATPISFWGYLISLGISYLINIAYGASYLIRHDIRDGSGEFIY